MEQVFLTIVDILVWIFTGSSKADRPNSVGLRLLIVVVVVGILSLLFWWLLTL